MRYIVINYAAAALLTFGAAWNLDYEPSSLWATAGEVNTTRAFVCGMAWPLYWSAKAFTIVRKEKP